MKRKSGALKKLAALCLTLLMALGMLGTTAFAAVAENSGSIKVEDVEEGVTVNAYRVLDVNFDYVEQEMTEPSYIWNAAVQQWVKDNFPAYINAADNSVTEAFSEANATDIAAFYDEMAAAVKKGDVTLAAAGTREGSGAIQNLLMGGYLILIENGMKVYRPSAVNLVPDYTEGDGWTLAEAKVTVKSSEPGIEKTVNEADKDSGAISDTFTFDITADVPNYPDNAIAKGYAISDTLPAGLTLDSDSLKVYGVAQDGETELTPDTHYTKGNVKPSDKGTTTFTLTFNYDQIKTYSEIHVEYIAKLNKDAVIGPNGNINDAALDYNNNPYDSQTWKEKEDKVPVYSYGLKVNKVNNKQELLTGAEFTLSNDYDGNDLLKFLNTGDGTYRLAEASEQSTAVTTLVVCENGAAKGTLQISGLAEGTYYLTETKAADGGYNKLNSPVQVVIKDTDMNGKPANGSDGNEFEDGYVEIEVVNTTGFTLPTTGGIGTVLFTAGGIAVMGAAVILFFALRRRKAA